MSILVIIIGGVSLAGIIGLLVGTENFVDYAKENDLVRF